VQENTATQLEKDLEMIEATTNPAARNAMENAHMERAKAMKDAWHWLFGSKTSR